MSEKIDIVETKGFTKADGIPPMDKSASGRNYRGFSTSKYLLNDEEDDKLSSISEMFESKDEEKFVKVYNMQGHYSATQSVESIFPAVWIYNR